MKNKILVSVIMNCYNSETFLESAISSILNQSYKYFELIFWDNVSTDNSYNILSSFNDKRIKYFKSDKHTTLYEARNLALEHCRGKLITFLDCDDIWYPNKLELQIEKFNLSKSIIYGKYDIIDLNNNVIGNYSGKFFKGYIKNKLLITNPISIGAIMIPREFLDEQPFDKFYNLLGDFDLWFRLSSKYRFEYVDKVIKSYRVHDKSTSQKLSNNWTTERRYFYTKNMRLVDIINLSFLRYIFKTEVLSILNKLNLLK